MELAEFLKWQREEKGFSQRGLAIKMGVSNASISDIESGRQNPKLEMLEKFAKALNISLSFLLSVQRGYSDDPAQDEFIKRLKIVIEEHYQGIEVPMIPLEDFIEVDMSKQIPLIGVIRAGEPIIAEQNIEGYITVDRNSLCPDKTYYALNVKGDSMDKLFPEGTTLVVEKTEMVDNNQIAVIGINGYDATVKKVSFADENIALIPESYNPAYTTQVYNSSKDEIHIMGRVVQAIRHF